MDNQDIVFVKVPNKVWYREYEIYYNKKYIGFISRTRRKYNYEVFIKYVFTPTLRNDEFKTLRKIKQAILKKIRMIKEVYDG